jgi:DNA-binding beta-propeller fold protein YncE
MKSIASRIISSTSPNWAARCGVGIFSGFGLLSAAVGFCPAAHAGVLYSHSINTISATGIVTPFATELPSNGPIGLAFDKDGYLYASIYVSNLISKISPDGKTVTVFATGLGGPYAQAFDPDGNLFVANADAKTISKISPDEKTVTPFVTQGLNRPVAIAFDASGTMYVSA